MLKNDILRNFSQNYLGVLRGAFEGLGCQKRHPDTLLAKAMHLRQKHQLACKLFLICCRQNFQNQSIIVLANRVSWHLLDILSETLKNSPLRPSIFYEEIPKVSISNI